VTPCCTHALEIVANVDVVALGDAFGDDRLGARHSAQQFLDLLRDFLDSIEIRSLDLDANGRLDAAALHHHAAADRLHPRVDVADRFGGAIHLGHELVARHSRPPLRLRLQQYRRFDHRQRSRVRRRVGPADLAEDARHFWERFQLLIHLLHDPPRLAVGRPGSVVGM
jgi:hypothetical protein